MVVANTVILLGIICHSNFEAILSAEMDVQANTIQFRSLLSTSSDCILRKHHVRDHRSGLLHSDSKALLQ